METTKREAERDEKIEKKTYEVAARQQLLLVAV